MRLIIISGRSGSGKSVCLNVLEDMGYYCVDNLPVTLLPLFIRDMKSVLSHVAVSIDARNTKENLDKFTETVKALRDSDDDCEIIFTDAEDPILLKRFSETRRRHPLSNDERPLSEALAYETQLLEPISAMTDFRIDTSHLTLHQLRDLMTQRIGDTESKPFSLLFLSFGYKFGSPPEADFVFDVRCLPNPYWENNLRTFTGKDAAIVDFLEQFQQTNDMYESIAQFMQAWLPHFQKERRNYLTVAIGCTGGQHRSVYMSEKLYHDFKTQSVNCQLRHRELT